MSTYIVLVSSKKNIMTERKLCQEADSYLPQKASGDGHRAHYTVHTLSENLFYLWPTLKGVQLRQKHLVQSCREMRAAGPHSTLGLAGAQQLQGHSGCPMLFRHPKSMQPGLAP